MYRGLVIKSTGSWYHVQMLDGLILRCRLAGKMKQDDLKLTNPIAVGDMVEVEVEKNADKQGIIRTIEPRKNYVVRQSPRKRHQLHFLASNIDQALLIVTLREPNLKVGFIDRFLMMTEPYSIPVIIVFNKSDLFTEQDSLDFTALSELYESLGYKVVSSSSVTGDGIDILRACLRDKITLVSGQSGVGKSTLINCIEPGLALKTDAISDFSGKGQHTTTFAEMFPLKEGGQIIDTPGIKSLAFTHLEVQDIAHNFREMFVLSSGCRFANCTHRNEPNCAIKKALEDGSISPLRYQNYLSLLEEVEDQNYWERHSDV